MYSTLYKELGRYWSVSRIDVSPEKRFSGTFIFIPPLPHIAWKGPCYQIYSISSTLLLICSIIRLLNSLIPDSSLFCLEPMEINKHFNELLMKRLECLSPTLPNIRNIMAPDFYNLKIGLKQSWKGKVIMDSFFFASFYTLQGIIGL